MSQPAPSPLRRLDRALFSIEQAVIALFLVVITVVVFLEVMARQLETPDSRIGRWLASAFSVTSPETRTVLDGTVAPFVFGLVSLGFLAFGASHAERNRGRPFFPFRGSALVTGALTLALLGGIGWMMLSVGSGVVYATLLGAAAAALAWNEARTRHEGWSRRLATGVGLLVAAAAVSLGWMPRGYIWSKELAMLCVLWVGLFGASVCVPIGKHIRIESLEKAIPDGLRRHVAALGHAVTASFTGLLAWLGYRYVFAETGTFYVGGRLEHTGIPFWVQTLAVLVAFSFTTVRFLAAAVSALSGGDYGAPAKAEGMEEAEKRAAEERAAKAGDVANSTSTGEAKRARPTVFLVVVALVLVLPFFGPGGILAAAILALTLLGVPIFVLLGAVVIVCFMVWPVPGVVVPTSLPLVERIVGLADNQALLAIPFFVMSGAVMSHGQISRRLVGFSMSLVGWLPGGLAVSAVLACMIFAAISGSSPATVVAIGGMMAPALIEQGFRGPFAHGLVTSAGSLGILIPPSIPMIVYAIVNTRAHIEVERLFASGYGPGLVIGGILMVMGMVQGVRDKTPRQPFSGRRLWEETRDGFWALLFPIAISLGIYSGVFNAIESACFSVVYAVVVEVFVHRALKLSDVPKVFQETGVMLGSFLVILVVAMSFGEFLDQRGIPQAAAGWVESMHLAPWQFLLVVNALLLVVGCLLDIMSAIFIFVPLLAPMAQAAGIDPLHFGIMFIVNMEIGYLTPPVGLNLFIASTLFDKPVGYITRAVLPFVAVMLVGLAIITFSDGLTVGFANVLMGPPASPMGRGPATGGETGELDEEAPDADGTAPPETFAPTPRCEPPEDLNCDGDVTMDEMTAFVEQQMAAPSEAPPAPEPAAPAPAPGAVPSP